MDAEVAAQRDRGREEAISQCSVPHTIVRVGRIRDTPGRQQALDFSQDISAAHWETSVERIWQRCWWSAYSTHQRQRECSLCRTGRQESLQRTLQARSAGCGKLCLSDCVYAVIALHVSSILGILCYPPHLV